MLFGWKVDEDFNFNGVTVSIVALAAILTPIVLVTLAGGIALSVQPAAREHTHIIHYAIPADAETSFMSLP
jgi:hypothetical protein